MLLPVMLQGGQGAPEFDVTVGPPVVAVTTTTWLESSRIVIEAVSGPDPAARAATTSATAAARASATGGVTSTSSAPPATSTTAAASRATTTSTTARPLVTLPALLPVTPAQKSRTAHSERGQASWFNAPDRTCAHRTLPFGTVVHVTRVYNGATTTCTVDQWGPADTTRIIDLSMDTFELLADAVAGLIEVVIEW